MFRVRERDELNKQQNKKKQVDIDTIQLLYFI